MIRVALAITLIAITALADIKAVSNQEAAQSCQQSAGGAAPVLVENPDGSSTVEWHGSADITTYQNNVETKTGTQNTPELNGNFYKAIIQGDVRKTFADQTINFFQFGLTHSNDHSVIASTPAQFSNLQMGRSGLDYYVGLGDIAPNFSKLSSGLGARGVLLQKQISDFILTGYAGVLSDSWEMLGDAVVRTNFLKDVYGFKLEKPIANGLKLFVTTQAGTDRPGSITDPVASSTALATKIRAGSVGAQYSLDQFSITAEKAQGGAQQETLADRKGEAFIADATWRKTDVSLKTGYHNLDPGYASLSAAAIPGVEEVYGGVDYAAKKWLTVGFDANNSKSKTLATASVASQITETKGQTARANFKLHPDSPDWSLNLQKNNSSSTNTAIPGTVKNEQNTAGVKYESQVYTGGLSYSTGTVRNEVSPTANSDASNWQAYVSRPFKIFSDWTLSAGLTYGVQDQRLIAAGTSSMTTNRGLTISGERAEFLTFGFSLSDGSSTRPGGLSNLNVLSKQLDMSHPFTKNSVGKLYVRNSESNLSDPLLAVQEQSAGLDYSYAF